MRNLVIGVLVLVAGIGYYWHSKGQAAGAEVKAYGSFIKALRSTRVADAKAMAHGDQAEQDIQKFIEREADRYRVRGSINIHRTVYKVDQRHSEGDIVYLDILEELRVDPPGANSTMGVANVWLRHGVEMQQLDGQWKVLAFSSEFENAEGMDGIDVDNAHRWF